MLINQDKIISFNSWNEAMQYNVKFNSKKTVNGFLNYGYQIHIQILTQILGRGTCIKPLNKQNIKPERHILTNKTNILTMKCVQKYGMLYFHQLFLLFTQKGYTHSCYSYSIYHSDFINAFATAEVEFVWVVGVPACRTWACMKIALHGGLFKIS